MAKKASKTIQGNSVVFAFEDDQEPLVLDLTKLSPEIVQHLATHGGSQKVGDSYAGTETVADARAAATKVVEDLMAGNWKAVRASSGGVKTTLLVRALARVASEATGKEVTLEDAKEVIAQLTAADEEDEGSRMKGLRARKDIKAAQLVIQQEDLAKKEDTGEEESLGAMFGS